MAPDRTVPRWRTALVVLAQVAAVAFVVAPVAVVHAVGNVHFDDQLGTVPVEVSLCHNGYTSLETGLLGTVYYDRTGFLGFGACMRITEPPEAGGTLGSYVDPAFIRTNAQLVNDPDSVAAAYSREFARSFRHELLKSESVAVLLGLLLLLALRRPRSSGGAPWWGERFWVSARLLRYPLLRAVLWPALVVAVAFLASGLVAARLFQDWPGTRPVGDTYPLAAVAGLSFSSPQAREVASQVQPFIEKNTDRLQERSRQFEGDAGLSFDAAVARLEKGALEPRPGEKVVLAEADPQGSFTGTAVRERIYPTLLDAVGGDIAVRTISGDLTSNGTVAEDSFVRAEADAIDIPTIAAKGDHDSARTVAQMKDRGIGNPDLSTDTVDGLRVTVANDPEFKTLFGGSVTNPTGVTETAVGRKLRAYVDPDEARIVVVHQAVLAAAYLGVDSLSTLKTGHETVPYDDGIPDVPPGTVDVGHSHRSFGPYVIWNTDTDKVTWTVVDRLGTSGGAENSPTFNRFSTPTSVPLKPIDLRLQYFDQKTGLQTGYVSISISTAAQASIGARVDVGLPLDR